MNNSDDRGPKVENSQEKIRSLWVPLREMNLLIPGIAVAEIGSYRVPEARPGQPEWLLGSVKWQQQVIPVISLETVCGFQTTSSPVFSRLMVVNSVRPGSAVSHYAIVTTGLPGLVQFGHDSVADCQPVDLDGLQMVVRIGSEQAYIPDLVFLQRLLEQHFDIAA